MKKITTLTALATSILLAQHAYAFEAMTDESLGAVTWPRWYFRLPMKFLESKLIS